MYPYVKRCFDIVFSLVMILLTSPIMLLTAVLIKLTSRGPVFFVQPRGGRLCRPFPLVKFRTMYATHVHDPREVIPLNHQGITPLGRALRRAKIDELPQFFNILVGHMSLIGPRPTIMDQVERYDAFQRRRQDVRPGITGLAQVNSTALMDWDERIRYDVYYVDHLGPALDLLILLKTIPVLLLGEERFARPFEQSPYAAQNHPKASPD